MGDNSPCLVTTVGNQQSCPALLVVRMVHSKCRGETYKYGRDEVARLPVPEEKVPWSVEWPDYAPQDFTAPFVQGKEWADPAIQRLESRCWSLWPFRGRIQGPGPYQ